MSQDDDPPLIRFQPREPEKLKDHPPISHKRRCITDPACKHNRYTLDKEARRVHCALCKVELDPIEVLSQISSYCEYADRRVKEIREYERKQRDRAERDRDEKKSKVPGQLASLRPGDDISVTYDRGCMSSGFFAGMDGTHLTLTYPDEPDYQSVIELNKIEAIRVRRRAKRPAHSGAGEKD